MNLGVEDKKKLAILSVAGVGALAAIAYMYTELFPSNTAPATPANVALTSAKSAFTSAKNGEKPLGTTAAALDPTLHMGPMLTTEALEYKGTGRNIFSSEAAPETTALPRPVSPARPTVTPANFTPQGPPPIPPIDLKFFGTATNRGKQPRAFLLRGEDVFLASAGDIVQRRYKILSIGANSIVVLDLTDNNQQALPLTRN